MKAEQKNTDMKLTNHNIELKEYESENLAYALDYVLHGNHNESIRSHNYEGLDLSTLYGLCERLHDINPNWLRKFKEGNEVFTNPSPVSETTFHYTVLKRTECYVWLKPVDYEGETRKCKIYKSGRYGESAYYGCSSVKA